MSDSLFEPKHEDGFKTESPLRAFTTFDDQGQYAIGKGFRPSVAHLAQYLDAIETKEGWQLVQILIGDNDPTLIFRRCGINMLAVPGYGTDYEAFRDRLTQQIADALGIDYATLSADYNAVVAAADEEECEHEKLVDVWQFGKARPVNRVCADCGMAFGTDEDTETAYDESGITAGAGAGRLKLVSKDDPINPAHYGGDHCAQIGELLTANSYQVLKYNWRLGKKDETCVELGKSLWYLDREIALAETMDFLKATLPSDQWLADRLIGCSDYTTYIAVQLWSWNQTGRPDILRTLKARIEHAKVLYECGTSGLAL